MFRKHIVNYRDFDLIYMSVAAALRSRFIFECYEVRSQSVWIIRTPVGNLSGIVGGLME